MARGSGSNRDEITRALPRDEVFGGAELASTTLQRYLTNGRIKRLARGLYTSNIVDDEDAIVRRNRYRVVSLLFPNAVITGRSTLDAGLRNRDIFIAANERSTVVVGPFRIHAEPGSGPQETDMRMPDGVFLASPARSLLENARLTRGRGDRPARTLSQAEIEEWLETERDTTRGVEGLRRLLAEAREIAPQLDLPLGSLELIEGLIEAVIGERKVKAASPLLRARQIGLAYDPARIEIFEQLRDDLTTYERKPIAARPGSQTPALPFFEAYFSNYIEGTEFEVEEAIEIVYEGHVPQSRPQDAHDILGTYAIVSDPAEMRRAPGDADEFIDLIRERHARMLAARPEIAPGVFKTGVNRAGGTRFVQPDRVLGTLVKGFDVYRELPADPFARALFVMFLVAEVHPFNDGNGRIARIMMNSELVAAGEERIIIPQAHRTDYIGSLKRLTHYHEPDVFLRVMDRHQEFVHTIDFSDLETARAQLEARDAFLDPIEADFGIGGLNIPDYANARGQSNDEANGE